MHEQHIITAEKKRIDWIITLVPFFLNMGLAVYLFIFPEQANGIISQVRFFFGDTLGSYYIIIGIGFLAVSRGPERKTEIFFLYMGKHDVHLRPGGRYPVLQLC